MAARKPEKANGVMVKREKKASQSLTKLWNEIPPWMRDNHFITSGYRPQSNSYHTSLASLSHLHNETANIWTHLLGALLAASTALVLYTTLRPRFAHATNEDIAVFAAFFLGAIACLGMSATFHTILNHSEAVAKFGQRLDHIGIVVLIWGSFIPSIYYGFSAEPQLIRLYWAMITTIGAGTLLAVLHPKFRSPEWRPLRAFMFVAMGLSAVFPVFHGLQLYGYAQLERKIGLSWMVLQGMLYIAGAGIYAVSTLHQGHASSLTSLKARVPERWRPGTFDIWGSSHQIFHILVVFAAAAHLVGLLKAFDYEHSFRSSIMTGYANARKLGGL